MKRHHLALWKFQQRGQRCRDQQKGTHGRVGYMVCPILEDSKYMLSEYLDLKKGRCLAKIVPMQVKEVTRVATCAYWRLGVVSLR